jgi:hypothetical protein
MMEHKECGGSGHETEDENFSAPFKMHFGDKAKATVETTIHA